MFNSGLPGGAHGDILNATPTGTDSINRLIEEIKSRARASFASGNYPEAEVLYSKGIDTVAQPDAVLFANRALARLNLGKIDEAIEDSDGAIQADGAYVKGYWRKGQAYVAAKRTKEALAAFEEGLKIEPGNKALAKEADKARIKLEQEEMFEDNVVPPPISPNKAKKSAAVKSSPAAKAQKKSSAPKPPEAASKQDEADASDFNKSDHVRGYKVNKDGKKTSFFNNDLTDEAKQLIGDITPKQITAEIKGVQGEKGKSAWNHAGTWEEKDCSVWANESLKERLNAVEFTLPSGCVGAKVSVDKITDYEGSASVATVRGKRRFIFEFIFTLTWCVEIDGDKCTGTMNFPDVAPDCDGEYESLYRCDAKLTPPAARPLLDKFVKNDHGSFKEQVQLAINEWVKEFNAKY